MTQLGQCSEGVQECFATLNTLMCADTAVSFQMRLEQAMRGVLIPLLARYGVEEDFEAHVNMSAILAYMGMSPEKRYRKDAHMLNFSDPELAAVACEANSQLYQVLLTQRGKLNELLAMASHGLAFNADSISYLNLLERALKEFGYPVKPGQERAAALGLLTEMSLDEADQWLSDVVWLAGLDAGAELTENEKQFRILIASIKDIHNPRDLALIAGNSVLASSDGGSSVLTTPDGPGWVTTRAGFDAVVAALSDKGVPYSRYHALTVDMGRANKAVDDYAASFMASPAAVTLGDEETIDLLGFIKHFLRLQILKFCITFVLQIRLDII